MNGKRIKELLVANNINLNEHSYFENAKVYGVNEIPIVRVNKSCLKKKLMEKHKLNTYCIKYVWERKTVWMLTR